METSIDLLGCLDVFVAKFEIGYFKIKQQERNIPELLFFHNQLKDSFRLDRVERVRHHVQDLVDESVSGGTVGEAFGLVRYPKNFCCISQRALLSSAQLIEESKKGNLTPPAAIAPDSVWPDWRKARWGNTEDFSSDQVSTASANDSTRESIASNSPSQVDREKMLFQILDDILVKKDVLLPGQQESQLCNKDFISLKDVSEIIREIPDHSRRCILESICDSIIHVMPPCGAKDSKSHEEPKCGPETLSIIRCPRNCLI